LGTAVVAIIAAAVAGFIVVALARQQIGGYSGDTLGAVQQAAELAVLLAVAALARA
jgi:adenosylcobinamide-GDP ribazoletransferase